MIKYLMILTLMLMFVLPVNAKEREPWNMDGQFKAAYIADSALAVLRKAPNVKAVCLKRLHTGRRLYILSSHQSRDGIKYYYVAVTRRTRGYIDAESLVSPMQTHDDMRLMKLIGNANGIEKILLAQLLSQHFPASPLSANALLVEGETAEQLAQELSQRTTRHLPQQLNRDLPIARYLLNYSGLDRYSRLGIEFAVDAKGNYYYTGAAYQKILVRYRKSVCAQAAQEHLTALKNRLSGVVNSLDVTDKVESDSKDRKAMLKN